MIVGRRGTGKTNLLETIWLDLEKQTEFDKILWCSVAEDAESEPYPIKEFCNYVKENRSPERHFLLVIDDYVKDLFKTPEFRELVLNGPVYRLSIIITVQYFPFVPPEIRMNMDTLMFFRECNKQNLNHIHRSFGGVHEFDTFTKNISNLPNFHFVEILQYAEKQPDLTPKKCSFNNETKPDLSNLFHVDKEAIARAKSRERAKANSELINELNVTIDSLVKIRNTLKNMQYE
jgi:hypothetical protein